MTRLPPYFPFILMRFLRSGLNLCVFYPPFLVHYQHRTVNSIFYHNFSFLWKCLLKLIQLFVVRYSIVIAYCVLCAYTQYPVKIQTLWHTPMKIFFMKSFNHEFFIVSGPVAL